jgi:hypothetical protein
MNQSFMKWTGKHSSGIDVVSHTYKKKSSQIYEILFVTNQAIKFIKTGDDLDQQPTPIGKFPFDLTGKFHVISKSWVGDVVNINMANRVRFP